VVVSSVVGEGDVVPAAIDDELTVDVELVKRGEV
jgi:hypothetical protein